jgi:uncharacterized protein (DUF433 family)
MAILFPTAAAELIVQDPEIMGGAPVFAGTRVPVDSVLASLDEGETLEGLQRAYPMVTQEHVEAARLFRRANPSRGRPRRLEAANPSWRLVETHELKPAGS